MAEGDIWPKAEPRLRDPLRRRARPTRLKTLQDYDFSFQPSRERDRIVALAQLDVIERKEVVHLLGPPGTGKTHLATALGIEAVKASKSVYFGTLAEIIASLEKSEREGQLQSRFLTRNALLSLLFISSGPPTDSSPPLVTRFSS